MASNTNNYLQEEDLILEGWDREKEIGLIAAPCGVGKTYASVRWLPQFLGYKPSETLLLSPRAAIREQTLETYHAYTVQFGTYDSAFGSRNGVSVTTVHQIGRWYRLDMAYENPKLVIIDEFHSLFSENVFAQDLIYFYQQFLEWAEDPNVCVVVLTATTMLPLQFVNSCPFAGFEWIYESFQGFRVRNICRELDPQYKIGNVQIESGKSLETVLRKCPASADNKQLVFARGKIERLGTMADTDENATWLCSTYSKSEIGGVKACELMSQEHYSAVINGHMPKGINRIYLSSAYREGLNVHDPDVREVIIEGATDIEIVQALGRVRHSIDRLVIVLDARRFPTYNKRVSIAKDLLKAGNLKRYFEQQLDQERDDYEGEKLPILVYEDIRTRELKFNFLALAFWLFEYCGVTCALQRNQTEIEFSGEKLPRKQSYFAEMLEKYVKGKISYDLISFGKPNLEAENREKVLSFDWSSWSGREVYGASARELANALGLQNSDYSQMAVSGIFKKWPERFEGKHRLKRDGKRQIVYVIA